MFTVLLAYMKRVSLATVKPYFQRWKKFLEVAAGLERPVVTGSKWSVALPISFGSS